MTAIPAPILVTGGRRRVDLGRLAPACTADWHGTCTAYRKAKCRCPHAREAHRLYQKRAREGRNVPALTDATGARRRIQGMWALGHPSQVIADMCGGTFDRRQIQRMCIQQHITPHHHDLIAATYAVLITRPGTSVRTRRRAAAAGYPLPVQWGANIDDPQASPDPLDVGGVQDGTDDPIDEVAVERALAGERVDLTDIELVAMLQAGTARGIPLARMADQQGINYFGARKMLGGDLTPRRRQQQRVEAELLRVGHLHNDATLAALLDVHHQTVTRARARLARRGERVAS
ncbi:hypothetical protein FHR83_006653 [Actinoplanes campanulatus]|uniref:Uncharacterized protein n=1 Tax=Actinoplanes campanulatus TaxID=113559 RepID=A0A7W5AMT7_9ACTN|nr:hypothetical protein [Actinoplanes campanulatus]MBB3098947.1 hypothetical protein [Actinoplanes campanulatus]GGN39726.1 hypothetical protein GCM10010109_68030 [Actinoplanes campanulatus]